MASLTAPSSSPTSLQLRFSHRCREPPRPVTTLMRSRTSIRCIHPISAARAQATEKGQGGSWSGFPAGADSFSGWSDGGGDPNKKGGYGDILGAALAGVLFAAGVAFASLSLINKTNSGPKKQMKPLTAEQEVLLTSGDRSMEVDQDAKDSFAALPDKNIGIEGSQDSDTGTNKDLSPTVEINEDATEGWRDNIHHLETLPVQNIKTDTDSGAIHEALNQVDLQTGPDINNIAISSNSNTMPPELSVSDLAKFSNDASSIESSNHTAFSDIPDPTGYASNTGTDLSSYSTDSTNQTTSHQGRSLGPEGTVDSEDPLNFSAELEGQIPSEPVTLEPTNSLGYDVKVLVEAVAPVSEEQDIEHGSMTQRPIELRSSHQVLHDLEATLPSEVISPSGFDNTELLKLSSEFIDSAEGHKSNESVTSIPSSESELSGLNGEVPDIDGNSQIDRSLSFEPLLSETTFSFAGIPAPSIVSAALQVPPGKVLVPAVVDQVQEQTLAALQVLKVIEADVQPGDLCTRREYARWLVAASSALSRNTTSKVYPAMYIENMTELAFDDVTPEDPDFPYIQGLAEAGIISSKLSRSDIDGSFSSQHEPFPFSPESPLSRQDLVSWKMALERRLLPEVNRNDLYKHSGYIDIDKINPDAWPALVADLSAGEQGITAPAFGLTRLFQPNKPVTKAQAAIALAIGDAAEVVVEELTRIEAESLAESAVNAHTALVEQVEKDLNANFEKALAKEKEKIEAVEKLAEKARLELERLREERDEENNTLLKGRAAVESEMEVLTRLRYEVEEQLQELMSKKTEISFERDRINKLRQETESENQAIVQLQYELEVERKALSMARTWAEEEAKRAREQAKSLEEARDRWERRGIKVVVDPDLQDDASAGVTWLTAGEQPPIIGTINRAESLLQKLRDMAAEIKVKSTNVIELIIQKIVALISALKQWAYEAPEHAKELGSTISSKASSSIKEFQQNASGLNSKASRSVEEVRENAYRLSSSVGDKARKAIEDCKESVDRITQKFKV